MTQRYLLDSDILIYHINGQLEPGTEKFLHRLFQEPVYISVISRMEILGWQGHTDESWQMTNALLKTLNEIGLDEEVVQMTIGMRRRLSIKLPDAIIASSAITRRLTLLTRNVDDFRRVSGLSLVNPFDLPVDRATPV